MSSTIQTVPVATNRYAPAGSDAINLYSTETAPNLTLGQLVQAACMKAAAAQEAQSVLKMNTMTAGSEKLDQAATWLKGIAEGTADWNQAKAFLVDTMGIPAGNLPDDIKSYDKRMQAASALKDKMDTLSQAQQEAMVELQSMVNRRDVAHSTSSNVVRALGTSLSSNAANF
ncbi:MAG: hypothetical protein IK066_02920 [Kiritimatiellae bacterium]|nr:hypothetical protein [Kiritimatiellia bacterium]